MKTAIITGLVVLALVATALWYAYDGSLPFSDPAPRASENADPVRSAAEAPLAAPIYVPLDPPFLVNFQIDGTLRFLQVSMEVMTRDRLVVKAVDEHMPYIRNNLLLLLSNQSLESIATLESKEQLRARLLAEIQAVLDEVHGAPGVEALYFTAFVMQ